MDELRAIGILSLGKKLPKALENRLIATKDERVSKRAPYRPDGDIDITQGQKEFNNIFSNPHGVYLNTYNFED